MNANSVLTQKPTANAEAGDYFRQFAVIVVTLATIAINGLATGLPLNGQSTGEISDRFPSLFTPAGYVFSIWGVIYLGLLAYMVFQALPSQRTNPRMRSIGWLYVASGVANSVWIFLWHYNQFAWSLVVMLVLLASLVGIYLRLSPFTRGVGAAERWTTHIPFSIYLGWITVATVANTATVLLDWNWSGGPLSPALWAILMIAVATVLGLIFALREVNPAYVLVLVWAFAGIAVKQSATPAVAWTAIGAAVLLVVAVVAGLLRNRRSVRSQPLANN
ncbi:MAG: tryptophan-rich sensory protein [Caldilinea sp.]|nr:tryptophan-rich sensory protein [Caldilinea sp.]